MSASSAVSRSVSAAQSRDLLDQAPEGRLVVRVEIRGRGADQTFDLLVVKIRADLPEHAAQQAIRVALDACGPDGHRRLAGEDGQQLHVAQREGRRAPLVEDLEHANRALLVEQRRCRDRARDVAGLLRRVSVESGVVGDVGERERLARRIHVAGDALRGRHRQSDGAGALLTRRDTKLEPVGILLEQRDRRGFGIEELHRRVDDALKQPRLDVALEAAPDVRTPRRRNECGERGVRLLVGHGSRPV